MTTGPHDKTIFIFSLFYILIKKERQLDTAILATLALEEKLSRATDPFILWIKKSVEADSLNSIQENPTQALVYSQLHDLTIKVIVSTAFYFTHQLSIYSSLSHVVSHSERVSKVAQPILDKIFSTPVARFLESSRILLFAPVLFKLLQMALMHRDPKGEHRAIEWVKKGAHKVSQILEILWNIRFTLVCLGISETFYITITSTLYSLTVNHFVPEEIDYFAPDKWTVRQLLKVASDFRFTFILGSIPSLNHPSTSRLINVVQLLTGIGSDQWPTAGFSSGLTGTFNALFASSVSLNLQVLQKLHQDITSLSQLKGFDNVTQLAGKLKSIQTGLNDKKGPLTQLQVKRLRDLLHQKLGENLLKLLAIPAFETEVDKTPAFKELFFSEQSDKQANDMIALLKKAYTIDPSKPNEIKTLLVDINKANVYPKALTQWICERISVFYRNQIGPKMEQRPLEEVLKEARDMLALVQSLKDTENNTCKPIVGHIHEHITNQLKKKYTSADFKIELLEPENEKALVAIFGKEGLAYSLAESEETFYTAYLQSAEFYFKRFNQNLEWYLKNQPTDPKKQEDCELRLLAQAIEAELDYKTIAASSGFKKYAEENKVDLSLLPIDKLKENVRGFVTSSKDFDFTRQAPEIPTNFKFVLYSLPFVIGTERHQVGAPIGTWTTVGNFPLESVQEYKLRPADFPPFSLEKWSKDMRARASLLVKEGFVSSKSIREVS